MSRFWFNFVATVWLMGSGSAIWWGGSVIMRIPATSWELPTLGHLMVMIGAVLMFLPTVIAWRR